MRKMLIMAAVAVPLAGCYHTTVTPLPDNQQRVTFYNDAPPPFVHTSPIIAEDVALWTASGACPSGFKVGDEAIDLGSIPNTYSLVVKCKTPEPVTASAPSDRR